MDKLFLMGTRNIVTVAKVDITNDPLHETKIKQSMSTFCLGGQLDCGLWST